MKSIYMATIFLFVSQFSLAESQIACWGIKDKKGTRPVLTAQIMSSAELTNIRVDETHTWIRDYNYERKSDQGTKFTEVSKVIQPQGRSYGGTQITTKRSPYVGHQEFSFIFGQRDYVSGKFEQHSKYGGRWILPVDLSNNNLKNVRLRSVNERSNSVWIINPPANTSQSGFSYLRMFCVSK